MISKPLLCHTKVAWQNGDQHQVHPTWKRNARHGCVHLALLGSTHLPINRETHLKVYCEDKSIFSPAGGLALSPPLHAQHLQLCLLVCCVDFTHHTLMSHHVRVQLCYLHSSGHSPQSFFVKFIDFREKEGEKHRFVVPFIFMYSLVVSCMCPDWESNRRPFGSQAGTQSTDPHQPEPFLIFFKCTFKIPSCKQHREQSQ